MITSLLLSAMLLLLPMSPAKGPQSSGGNRRRPVHTDMEGALVDPSPNKQRARIELHVQGKAPHAWKTRMPTFPGPARLMV